jgi:hypothetical protein
MVSSHHVNQELIFKALEIESLAKVKNVLSRCSGVPLNVPQLLILNRACLVSIIVLQSYLSLIFKIEMSCMLLSCCVLHQRVHP